MRRNILVVGSTGMQGRAIINAFQNQALNTEFDDPRTPEYEYHIYALTRNASRLGETRSGITMVLGDLDVSESIVQVFEKIKEDCEDQQNAIFWGVVAVLMYPGLGANADGEERQGKLLADLALEYSVKSFIYSSGCRAGPKYEHLLVDSGKAKAAIETHCKFLGVKGLPWTIMRPGFFIENLQGFVGSVTACVLKVGLGDGTTFGLVGAEDVGNAVLGIFEDREKYFHKELAIIGQLSTITEVFADHLAITGNPLPAVPAFLGWTLLKFNLGLQDLMATMDRSHFARSHNEYSSWTAEVELGNSTCHIKTYRERLLLGIRDRPETAPGWNQISFARLFTGRS